MIVELDEDQVIEAPKFHHNKLKKQKKSKSQSTAKRFVPEYNYKMDKKYKNKIVDKKGKAAVAPSDGRSWTGLTSNEISRALRKRK